MEFLASLKSKADALVFAINKATDGSAFDKTKADDIYDYIISKVDLPDVEVDASTTYLNSLYEMVSRYGESISRVIENQ